MAVFDLNQPASSVSEEDNVSVTNSHVESVSSSGVYLFASHDDNNASSSNSLKTTKDVYHHELIDTPDGSVHWVPRVSASVLPVLGTVYDSLDECIEVYRRYASEAGFGVRLSCQKRLKCGYVKTKYLVCNREGCPKEVWLNTLDPKKNDRQVRLVVFDLEHNHELDRIEYKHLSKAERKLTYNEQLFIIKAANSNIGAVRAHNLYSRYSYWHDYVPCSSGQSLKQESHVVLKDGILFGKSSKNNISIRTGKEFSMKFLEECRLGRQPCNGNGKVENIFVKGPGPNVDMMESATLRGAAANSDVPRSSAPSVNDFVSSMAHQAIRVSEVKVPSNGMMLSNGNHHMAHEEVSAMLGLIWTNVRMMELATLKSVANNVDIPRSSALSANHFVPSLVHRASGVMVQKTLKYRLVVFDLEHNHELDRIEYKYLSKAKRKLTYNEQLFIIKAANSNIGAVRAHNLYSSLKGSSSLVHGTQTEFKNFTRGVNCFIRDSDAQMLITRFEERQEFTKGFSFDYFIEDAELCGLFWADEVAKCNYIEFGDIVSFDATYKTNKYKMVFVPLTAIDNHRRSVTVGSGLLKRESAEAYGWLLRAFKKAFIRALNIIVTDQDGVMRLDVAAEFPESEHRLFIIYDETNFKEKFGKIVWNMFIGPEEFEDKWNKLMEEFNRVNHKWLSKMYRLRSSWIPAFFVDSPLCGLMRTTSRHWTKDLITPNLRNKKNSYGEKNEAIEKLSMEASIILDSCVQMLRNNEPKLSMFKPNQVKVRNPTGVNPKGREKGMCIKSGREISMKKSNKKKSGCGICGSTSHNRRTCPGKDNPDALYPAVLVSGGNDHADGGSLDGSSESDPLGKLTSIVFVFKFFRTEVMASLNGILFELETNIRIQRPICAYNVFLSSRQRFFVARLSHYLLHIIIFSNMSFMSISSSFSSPSYPFVLIPLQSLSSWISDDHEMLFQLAFDVDTQRKQWVTISTSHPKTKLLLQDTSPSENTSEIHVEVKGVKLPEEEVIPIHRFVRTHRAPEHLCLNIEVEEHSLGDLNEPTNYKAAMLDPKSDKWLNAMNAKMQSMKDNQV
ncbi:FAR1-related sequence 5-like protein [Tanacetum coccineum]